MPLDDLIKKTGYDLSVFTSGSARGSTPTASSTASRWTGPAPRSTTTRPWSRGRADRRRHHEHDLEPRRRRYLRRDRRQLTIDKNGVRGDQPGFDTTKVATYGIGTRPRATSTGKPRGTVRLTLGWRLGDKAAWPTQLEYNTPDFIKTLEYIRGLRGPGPRAETRRADVSGAQQIGTGAVAMLEGGTWDATSITKVPGVKVGVAPTVKGPKGRSMISNSNANNIYVGTKNLDATWKWVTYMGSEACQSAAGVDATFLPSIAKSLQVAVDAQAKEGLDMSGFVNALKNGELYPAPPMANGQEIADTIKPLFEAYFGGQRDKTVFPEMADKTTKILGK